MTVLSPTSTAPPSLAPTPAALAVPLYRFSVTKYFEMGRLGILSPDDGVELLEGLVVQKMTKLPPHTLSTQLTRDALSMFAPAGWFVNDQEPVVTNTSV